MATTSTAKIKLDDRECSIASTSGSGFTFQDAAGNEVSMPLRAMLRCLSIAEAEKSVPALPAGFWTAVERHQ
ncbi:hypothetical protein LPN04_31110 [Rugamonas sp. A1-17]|nr:hypothetical protein [Rugamonas sp. A1-17]